MNKLRVLDVLELFNSNLIKKVGIRTGMTDLAKIKGNSNYLSEYGSYYIEGRDGFVGIVNPCGFIKENEKYLPNTGIRPVIDINEVEEDLYLETNNLDEGLITAFYGQYPQTLVDKRIYDKLEGKYQNKTIKITDRKYTLNYQNEDVYEKFDEYEYNNKKYVRYINDNDVYWLEVKPVIWYIDDKLDCIISKDILIKGIDTDYTNINESNILDFMNNHMNKEMFDNCLIKNKINIKK